MIEEDVKQTRCTTCDTEHVYKGGKAPRRKKPETTGALYKEVLAGITDQDAPPAAAVHAAPPVSDDDDFDEADNVPLPAAPPVTVAAGARPRRQIPAIDDDIDPDERQPSFDEGPVHRPLIRAQLARPEGIKIERQAPEFTIRQNPTAAAASPAAATAAAPMRTRAAVAAAATAAAATTTVIASAADPRVPAAVAPAVAAAAAAAPTRAWRPRSWRRWRPAALRPTAQAIALNP